MTDAELAEWFRPVVLDPGSPRLAAIAQATKKVAASISPAGAVAMVLLAHTGEGESSFGTLGDAIREVDSTFACTNTDLESRLAATVCCQAIMARNAVAAVAAGYAVLSAQWSGLASPVPALPGIAEATLRRRSRSLRGRSTISTSLDASEALKLLPEFTVDGNPVLQSQGHAIVQALRETVDQIEGTFTTLNKRVEARLAASDEELDLLWWAFSGHSELMNKPYSKFSSDGSLVLAIAFELAGQVTFPVQPEATRALLDRLLGTKATHSITLATAVNAAKALQLTLPVFNKQRLLPVLSSLQDAEELGWKAAWKGSVDRWSIDADLTSNCLDLAEQVVRELLQTRHPN